MSFGVYFFFFLIFQEIRIIMSFFHTNSQTCKTLNNKIPRTDIRCLFSTYAHNVIMHVCIINGLIFRDFFLAAISGINKKKLCDDSYPNPRSKIIRHTCIHLYKIGK